MAKALKLGDLYLEALGSPRPTLIGSEHHR